MTEAFDPAAVIGLAVDRMAFGASDDPGHGPDPEAAADVAAILSLLGGGEEEAAQYAFDPNEPRDEGGKWTEGGGGEGAPESPDPEKAPPWPKEWAKSWVNCLDRDEREAVSDYTENSDRINSQLRCGTLGGKAEYTVDDLDAALEKSITPHALTVFRGLSEDPQWERGDVYTDLGYSSFSKSRGMAEDFADDHGDTAGGAVLEVHIPEGSRAADIAMLSKSYASEGEVLAARDARFTVTDRREEGGRVVYKVTLETPSREDYRRDDTPVRHVRYDRLLALYVFDPAEKRDDSGKWTAGGGGGAAAHDAATPEGKPGRLRKALESAKGWLTPRGVARKARALAHGVRHPVEAMRAGREKLRALKAKYGAAGALVIVGGYVGYYTLAAMNPGILKVPVPLTPTLLTLARLTGGLEKKLRGIPAGPIQNAREEPLDIDTALAEVKALVAAVAAAQGEDAPEVDDDVMRAVLAGMLGQTADDAQ